MSEQDTINQRLEDRVLALEKGQQDIINLLKPISETYTTVSNLSKWLSAFLVLVSIVIGIVLGWKQIFK
jgi:hypothetical protein